MVFMGEEYGCSGKDLGKKAQETFKEFTDYPLFSTSFMGQ